MALGSNENNTDTMIVIHVDNTIKKITLFSVPRDLYYKGRRINVVYGGYGADRFLKEMSDITGLKIEKYVHVNLSAFIDAIDVIGGIDFYLESDLIDPSYKIKENGVWSTLAYKKGQYHFNGVQALRVARSRHFSSDFHRARRQQAIIVAVGEKIKNLGIQNVDKIYELFTLLLKYVQTNFNILEMTSYFSKFKDYKISIANVIDTSNVLYSTYSNLYLLTDEEREEARGDEEFNKGAWIVLPKGNDWNVIRWYVRELINK